MTCRVLAILCLLAALSPVAARAQAPVFFDAFFLDNWGFAAQDFNRFLLWDVSEGTVDLAGPSILNPFLNFTGRYVDLDGSTDDAGRFATRLPLMLLPGMVYTLSFDFMSTDGAANAATVSLGGTSFPIATSSNAFQGFEERLSVSSLQFSRLVFQDQGNDSGGIGIDNIVVRAALAVPECSTAILAIVGVGCAINRRSRKSAA